MQSTNLLVEEGKRSGMASLRQAVSKAPRDMGCYINDDR
jgi:hypothetical protein